METTQNSFDSQQNNNDKNIIIDDFGLDGFHCPNHLTGSISHPRVFLTPNHKKEINCPYCSTKYILKSND